jgi:hypothetical protein
VTGSTAYLILIGLTIEITLMFAIVGVIYAKTLPADPAQRILGVSNRLFIGLVMSCISVGVEELLHATGYFHWDYWWWNDTFPFLIVVFGYLWFFMAAAYVYDRPDHASRARVVGTMAGVVAASIVLFGPVLGWI